ncbi:unnamed protein product [Eruca vesicaria subsp. sativa]|uniref:CENP-V/GFA domain-containing protein n=1 Tax=Eruca vesicaria subsp. sativa TaxID=29727 RepID=A0ABC8LD57_ERUVS|nr:unnamed protein product [Eruca vesicaria subsp. sativa]
MPDGGVDFRHNCASPTSSSIASKQHSVQQQLIWEELAMESELVLHEGGCHCGKIKWRVKASRRVVAWSCNCTDCSMRGNVNFVVPASDFELLDDSKDFITTYTFGTHTAKHTFCKVCGITSFYIPRSNPDGVSVTVKCVKAGTLEHVEIRSYDGVNWERSHKETGIASSSKEAN